MTPRRRRTDDIAGKPRWSIEEADLVRRARGDADLLQRMRDAQTAPPADMLAFRDHCMRPLAEARATVGSYSALDSDTRRRLLGHIDAAIAVVEEWNKPEDEK